jgi:hypothetical protein
MRDAALDCGPVFCAELLTGALDLVGIPDKLLLSNGGYNRQIVNRNYYHKEKAQAWLSLLTRASTSPPHLLPGQGPFSDVGCSEGFCGCAGLSG